MNLLINSNILNLLFTTSILILTSVYNIIACDMFALIAVNNSSLNSYSKTYPDTNDLINDIYNSKLLNFVSLYDAFVFLGINSGENSNSDGYGIVYYNKNEKSIINSSQLFHQRGFNTFFTVKDSSNLIWRKPLLSAYSNIIKKETNTSIVLGHSRSATGGNTIGNHPFWFQYDSNSDDIPDKTFTFEHNGDCTPLKDTILGYLLNYDSLWFNKHPLNWASYIPNNDTLNTSFIIDSELLFHYIMAHIKQQKGSIRNGIAHSIQDLGALNKSFYHIINFILSDGEGVYAFKISCYNLEYKKLDSNTVMIKTGDESTFEDILCMNLLSITKDGTISSVSIPDLLEKPDPFPIKKPIIYELKPYKPYYGIYLLSGRKYPLIPNNMSSSLMISVFDSKKIILNFR